MRVIKLVFVHILILLSTSGLYSCNETSPVIDDNQEQNNNNQNREDKEDNNESTDEDIPGDDGVVIDKENFPFNVKRFVAKINVDTDIKEKSNNKLLCLNMGYQLQTEKLQGFNSELSKEFTRWYNPISLRFPQGAWGNFYNWETDGRSKYDDDEWNNGSFNNQMNSRLKFGIDGFAELHQELKFGILWVWSIGYKDEAYSQARLKDHLAKGLDVTDVELGNEYFWKTQRSSLLATDEMLVKRTESFAKALREIKPNLRFALPFSWRKESHDSYNRKLATVDPTLYNAIVIHKYVHTPSRDGGDDNPGEDTEDDNTGGKPQANDYFQVMTARAALAENAEYIRSIVKKPIWLTEWGVSCGDYAASYLGMADSYLYLFENQDIYEYAAWFQTHGGDDFFKTGGIYGHPVYTKTCYGVVYDMVRSVFENSIMLSTTVESEDLFSGVKAVSGRAVKQQDGTYKYFIVNLSNREIPAEFYTNGKECFPEGYIETLSFSRLDENRTWEWKEENLKKETFSAKGFKLKPYSINVISNITVL